MMPGKTIWKTGIGGIAKASRDIALEPQKGGGEFTAPHMKPQLQGANVLMHVGLWLMDINSFLHEKRKSAKVLG